MFRADLRAAPRAAPRAAFLAAVVSAVVAAVVATILAIVPASLGAQVTAPTGPPATDTRLSGTLVVGGAAADTGTVVLHRVTPEEAGPVDSVRVEAGGGFTLDLGEIPGPGGAMFFATYRHDGVVFFGGPISSPEALAASYDIEAWPSRPLPTGTPGAGPDAVLPSFHISFRNIFIEEGPDGWRVTDIFEVGHDNPFTWTSPDPEGRVPVWSHPLPPTATNIQAMEADVAPADLRLDRGALEVLAPFPPGDRLLVIRYDLPSIEATFPMPGTTGIVELLVREPAPVMRVDGLRADAPVEIERGSVYQRWWGEGVRDIAPRIRLGEEPTPPVAWVAVILALVLVAFGSWFVMRPGAGPGTRTTAPAGPPTAPAGPPSAPASPRPGSPRRSLLLEIARLDEAEAEGSIAPAEAKRRREALLARLAHPDPPPDPEPAADPGRAEGPGSP
jgi:hypothetical protein